MKKTHINNATIINQIRIHWSVFQPCVYIFSVIMMIAMAHGFGLIDAYTFDLQSERYFLMLLYFILSIHVAKALIDFFCIEYTLTDQYLLVQYGLIKTKTYALPLNEILSINIQQNALGQYFDYGDLAIMTTSYQTVYLKRVPYPNAFHQTIEGQMQTA